MSFDHPSGKELQFLDPSALCWFLRGAPLASCRLGWSKSSHPTTLKNICIAFHGEFYYFSQECFKANYYHVLSMLYFSCKLILEYYTYDITCFQFILDKLIPKASRFASQKSEEKTGNNNISGLCIIPVVKNSWNV